MEKPKLFMLIGLPGSGKSTWVKNFLAQYENKNIAIASSDDYIEEVAKREGKTYNQVFTDSAKDAMNYVDAIVSLAIKNQSDVIWDQTNLSKKSRAAKLARFKGYEKFGIHVYCEDVMEWHRRLGNRPGKTIPTKVLNTMLNQIEVPTEDEGFDVISEVRT